MSRASLERTRASLLAAAADRCAAQWAALGGLPRALGENAERTIVDPEALVLLSLVASEADPRLAERLGWWARVGARHTNLQRLRTLVGRLPPSVGAAWKSFASAAASHGRAGWRAHADAEGSSFVRERARGEHDEPQLAGPAALMLRLRAGLGVSAKVDVLALLIGIGDRAPLPASEIARELGFSASTTKRAARDMARARLIRETPGHPVEYGLDRGAWQSLLGIEGEPPRWRPWARLLPFVAAAIDWAGPGAPDSAYVRASRARDLLEGAGADLARWELELPDPDRHPGEDFEPAFLGLLERLAESLRRGA